jgi:cysteinyl-tRNA synthetase
MTVRLHDTLSGRLLPVRRPRGRPLDMYVCGPTVYAPAHVGHARTYLYFDVLRRTLAGERLPVKHVLNITDFEEKIDRRAEALGISWRQLARREETAFFRDMDVLGILRPDYRPRASEFIPRMVKVAARLAKTGRVEREGDAFYYYPPDRPQRQNFPLAAELSRHAVPEPGHPFPVQESRAGAFMVWQRQDPPLPSWPGPWGRGMPGWHLECYAMADRYLGVPVDLHGGGLDLIFPHHYAENEIALALDHRPFSRAFLHTGFVLQNGQKMSKSTGNLISIREALTDGGPGGLRWYLLSPPYSQRLEWNSRRYHEAISEHRTACRTISAWLNGGARGRIGARHARELAARVRADLTENLGTDRAIAHIREFVETLRADPSGRAPAGERSAARAALCSIELRLGIPLG